MNEPNNNELFKWWSVFLGFNQRSFWNKNQWNLYLTVIKRWKMESCLCHLNKNESKLSIPAIFRNIYFFLFRPRSKMCSWSNLNVDWIESIRVHNYYRCVLEKLASFEWSKVNFNRNSLFLLTLLGCIAKKLHPRTSF